MDIKNDMLWRIYLLLIFVVLSGLLIFGKAVKIHMTEGERWRAKADSLYVRYHPVKAERGDIFAANNSLLATSLSYFEVRMDLRSEAMSDKIFNDNIDTLSIVLAQNGILGDSLTIGGVKELLVNARKRGERYLLIKRRATYTELERIKQYPLFKLGRYKGGLIYHRLSKRERPFRLLAHRTIGYVRDNAKPVGLEGAFNNILAGEEGQQLMQRVAGGALIPVNDLTEIEPKHGQDITTTIDVDLQDITEYALLNGVKKHQANHGCAIVMEVATGAIRAIANIGKTEEGAYWETYNYAIGASTEPGSTYKLAAIMALMEDGYIKLEDSIDLEQGKTQFYEEEMVDASYHLHNNVTIKKAFEISSNVGIAKLLHQYYNEPKRGGRFVQRLKDMRLNQRTSIEIEGEGEPLIKEAYKGDWSGTTIPWMSIGYEVQITPLQLLTFYNAIANNGKMMKPYIVTEIQDFGESLNHFKPKVIDKQIASPKTIAMAQELLEAVVENGTAKKIKSEQYKIAGKTGTTQIDYKNKHRQKRKEKMKYQASFAGYFPADKPVYSCIIVINNPKQNGIYGGEVAGPIFKEISDKCYASKIALHPAINKAPKPIASNYQLPDLNAGFKPELKQVLQYLDLPYKDDTNVNWGVVRAEKDSLIIRNRTIKEQVIPSVVGMGLKDAVFILENLSLKVDVAGVGKVKRQSIKPGTQAKGQKIRLVLG